MSRPRVSVVCATYDASHLLRHALESLRRNEFEDWEALVVGDCCRDDSEDVVRALGDDRIRFRNLARNSGQQATPTNVALAHVRGEFVAFLNQDDLFLRHHLGTNLERMRTGDAGWICCPYAEIPPEQRDRIEARELCVRLRGFAPSGRFDPRRFHVASSWFLRRAVLERVGPWRTEARTFVTPSQDWLFRAWRRGIRIACPAEVSLVALFSGSRKGFLRERRSPEHEFVFRELIASDALRPDFDRAMRAAQQEKTRRSPSRKRGLRWVGRKLARGFEGASMHVGIHPNTARMILAYGGRGAYVRKVSAHAGVVRAGGTSAGAATEPSSRSPSP